MATLHEVTNQIHHLTSGRINGEQFTRSELEAAIKSWLREPAAQYIFEAELPDGKWLAKVVRVGSMYDYWVPETRKDEKRLWKELGFPE